ncbi:MAG: TlpA disulfide reductase family protein [Candidatus Lernaella stagnicola]|nr:TlpA disulfide reductase family protein [Candidatus Lernaella stagnicola]
MRQGMYIVFVLLLAFVVACGTAEGRYDGDAIDTGGDDDGGVGDDDASGVDDDDDINPEIENFQWVDADGNEVQLYDYLGKVVLLNTGAFWCAPCKEEAPSLQNDIWEEYGDEDFVLISLIVEDAAYNPATPQTAADWRGEFGLDFVVCADPDWSLRPYFEKEVIPFNLLLTRDFQIEFVTHEYDKDVLSLLIEDLL